MLSNKILLKYFVCSLSKIADHENRLFDEGKISVECGGVVL